MDLNLIICITDYSKLSEEIGSKKVVLVDRPEWYIHGVIEGFHPCTY